MTYLFPNQGSSTLERVAATTRSTSSVLERGMSTTLEGRSTIHRRSTEERGGLEGGIGRLTSIFLLMFCQWILKKQYVPVLAQIYNLRAQAECAPLVNIRAINEQPGKESNLGELVVQVDVGEPLQVDRPRRQQLGGRGLLPLRSQPNTLFQVLYEPLNNLSDDPHQGSPQEGEALPLGLLLAPT